GSTDNRLATMAALQQLRINIELAGKPTAPTAPLGTNTDQVATMAAVYQAVSNIVGTATALGDTMGELEAKANADRQASMDQANIMAIV
ncbi:hypothetical protein NL501_28645, partial [Klebsiella pneumoniae]|nr:hypothetical protein [Klebsiella pneumoniae]